MPAIKRSIVKTETVSKKIKLENEIEKTKKEVQHIKVEIEKPPNQFQNIDPEDYEAGPKNWHKIYNEVVEMRSKVMTPVDTVGCERMPNTITPHLKSNKPKLYRFQLLISLMLSSQTKDEVNFATMTKLNEHLGELNLENMSKLNEVEIDKLICKIGFHNRKAKYIKETCQILLNKFDGDIPKTIEDLISLPGVGPKMGYLILQNGWDINNGIGVDVHLHRLSLMWKWCQNKHPEKARLELEKWLPSKYWTDVNPLMVGFGQVVCVPRAPNCDICTLGKKGLCASRNRKLVNQPMTEARIEKLQKQRGDLTKLIENVL
ncbi:unnamed protein product [Candida verbasci]|uniref:Endonuclease III homolog n=1 Tax=Candida verbasci TaxID=1227364 RepID=A0A9W4XFR9_9ASCO|nr:unnamed protein product [Candida verbasci]